MSKPFPHLPALLLALFLSFFASPALASSGIRVSKPTAVPTPTLIPTAVPTPVSTAAPTPVPAPGTTAAPQAASPRAGSSVQVRRGMHHEMTGPGEPTVPLEPLSFTPGDGLRPLGMDQVIKGVPVKVENLDLDNMVYEDSSIKAVLTTDLVTYSDFKGEGYATCHIIRVSIADASQLRTAMSYDVYDQVRNVRAAALAESCNAIAACNGDFFKNAQDRCYVYRQGIFYRDRAGGRRDCLLIDSEGDFHIIEKATGETIQQAMDALPKGVRAVNVLSFGPALVLNGKAADIANSTPGLAPDRNDRFEFSYRMPRIALVQLGHLQYAIVEVDALKTDGRSGMTMQTFADYIREIFPEAVCAYNLDGGNSTNLLFLRHYIDAWNRPQLQSYRVHNCPESRAICDIIYFASLED